MVILLGALLSVVPTVQVRADSAAARNNEGNELYQEKRFDQALKKYVDAQALKPEAPELHYNIGNVLFRQGELDKAAAEYSRAASAGDRAVAQASSFNRGNALLQKGEIEAAIQSYIDALQGDSDDQDAKRNLELALRMLQQQQQQQQQPEQDQNDQPEEEEQQQPPPPQGGENDQQKQPPPQRRPGEMTEEEARQILDALREDEKDAIRKHARDGNAFHKYMG